MIAHYLILTPFLILAVLALVRFVGCDQLFGVRPVSVAPHASFVQFTTKDIAPSKPTTVTTDTFSATVTGGDLIVVWIWYQSNATTVHDVQDTLGSTYQPGAGPTVGTGALAAFTQEIWYAVAKAGGSGVTVTANFNAPGFTTRKAIFAHEYSGLRGTLELADSNTGTATLANPTASGHSISTSAILAFAAAIFQNQGAFAAPFTLRVMTTDGNISEDLTDLSSGTVQAQFNVPTLGDWLLQLVTFK